MFLHSGQLLLVLVLNHLYWKGKKEKRKKKRTKKKRKRKERKERRRETPHW